MLASITHSHERCCPKYLAARGATLHVTRNLSAAFVPNVGRPGPTLPVRFPCLSGTLNTPLRCLEPALRGPNMPQRDSHLVPMLPTATAVMHWEGRLELTASYPPYNRIKKVFPISSSKH